MISQIKSFEILWMQEFDKTQKVFKHIPDRALAKLSTVQDETWGGWLGTSRSQFRR